MRLHRLSPQAYRNVTVWAQGALVMIIVTGGAVRLTGSGLGCSDWPTCEQDKIVAPLEFHALVEFINRLFTGVVSMAVIAAVLGSIWRNPRRVDLTRWSWGLVGGVIGQIILGALLVKSELDPRFTIGHFLLSMVLLWNGQVLIHRAGLPDQQVAKQRPHRLARHSLVTVLAAVAVLSTGTIVTGSGPHGGDDGAARFDFAISTVARIHGTSVAFFLVLALGLRYRLYRTSGPQTSGLTKSADRLLLAIVAQGAVGYAQYFSGLPPLLVGVHLLGAAVVWMAALQLHLELAAEPQRLAALAGATAEDNSDADNGDAVPRAPILSTS